MQKERRFKTAIHWFRRDLRISDNTALLAASHAAGRVVPVYVVSDWKQRHGWTTAVRQEFLCGCLASLAKNLETVGGRLIFRTGARADAVLEALLTETGAEAIFFNRDPDPYGVAMETRVAAMAQRHGAEAIGCKDVALHERDELLNGSGLPYRVYSPYARVWSKLEKPAVNPKPQRLDTPPEIPSEPAPTLAHWELAPSGVKTVEPGEHAARERLTRFVKNMLTGYSAGRNTPAGQASSRISQDLRWGLLSARQVYHRCHALADAAVTAGERESAQKFLGEIAWRDFYMQILFHFPGVLDAEFNPEMRGLPWRGAEGNEDFARWTRGETGFPVVDAGMRQLATTGFMHNRVRMIVSMFCTKDLHVHWREGERWFNQHLVDGDIASNNGGWQWCAGTGADAAPYFRIQNPWTQSARHDPHGEYIKTFLPELRDVPPEKFHQPPAPGERLAKGYPAPILDHKEERERTLEMFKRHLRKEPAAGAKS